ncbi:MAG: hypothetical protein L6M37_03855 [Candidatus Methylarchaceae archaeon HK02M1]|nr:hypothetical protein [Candidatus Methylarchaceae archaeon HK02M1]
MTRDILLYVGSIVIMIWGISHIVPTRQIVKGFEPLSVDNRRIITMEWIAEGITLVFIGLLVLLVTALSESQNLVSATVFTASALMLIVMAGLTGLTGGRTSVVFFKICPLVKTAVAVLFFLGIVL